MSSNFVQMWWSTQCKMFQFLKVLVTEQNCEYSLPYELDADKESLLLKVAAIFMVNPFHAAEIFWYSQKTSETFWFSDVFRESRKGPTAQNMMISK